MWLSAWSPSPVPLFASTYSLVPSRPEAEARGVLCCRSCKATHRLRRGLTATKVHSFPLSGLILHHCMDYCLLFARDPVPDVGGSVFDFLLFFRRGSRRWSWPERRSRFSPKVQTRRRERRSLTGNLLDRRYVGVWVCPCVCLCGQGGVHSEQVEAHVVSCPKRYQRLAFTPD